MPPAAFDVRLAQALAERIAAAGKGRVCMVAMVGSRAHGTATPGSDLDLVILIETPTGEPRWTSDQVLAEKRRILAAVGPPPLKTDVWLRTTDQYEEARGVPGCMEHVAESEGVVVYSRPLTRRPVPRLTEEQVRSQAVLDWLRDAAADLERASALEEAANARRSPAVVDADVAHHALRAVQRSIVAACIWHRATLPTKRQPVSEAVSLLAAADPRLAIAVAGLLAGSAPRTEIARAVVETVRQHLEGIPVLRPMLASLGPRLRAPDPISRNENSAR